VALVYAALRAQLADAAWKAGKFLLGAFVGALFMLGSCTVMAGGAGVITLLGMGSVLTRGGTTGTSATINGFTVVVPPIQLRGGFVSDLDRFLLATAAGWTGDDALIAVAVSIAEDPSGDPAAEHVNDDGSIDKGLWQINSGVPVGVAWARWGGRAALADPATGGEASPAEGMTGARLYVGRDST